MTARFADAARLRIGPAAQLLGWRPDDFWRATPADLAHALAPPPAATGLITRDTIAQLMEEDRHG